MPLRFGLFQVVFFKTAAVGLLLVTGVLHVIRAMFVVHQVMDDGNMDWWGDIHYRSGFSV